MIINDYRKRSKNTIGTNQYSFKRHWTKSTYLNLLILPVLFGLCIGVKNLSEAITKPTHAQSFSIISPMAQKPVDDKAFHFGINEPQNEGYTNRKPDKWEIEH